MTIHPPPSPNETAQADLRSTTGAKRAGRVSGTGEKFHSVLGERMKKPASEKPDRTEARRGEEKPEIAEGKEADARESVIPQGMAMSLPPLPPESITDPSPVSASSGGDSRDGVMGVADGPSPSDAFPATSQGAVEAADLGTPSIEAEVDTEQVPAEGLPVADKADPAQGATPSRFSVDPSLLSAAVSDGDDESISNDATSETTEPEQAVARGTEGIKSIGDQEAGNASASAGPNDAGAFRIPLPAPESMVHNNPTPPPTDMNPFARAGESGGAAVRQADSFLIAGGQITPPSSGENPKADAAERIEVSSLAGVGQSQAAPVRAFEVAPAAEAARISPAHLLEQIVHAVRVESRNGRSEMVMRLNSPDLGHVHIRLVSEGGTVTAQFHAESEAVRATLQSHLPQLQEALNDAGIAAQGFTVSAGAEFGGSGQWGGSAQPEPARSRTASGPAASPSPVVSSSLELSGSSAGALDYLA
jgi:hypothetical protein